ncbi:MAG TPA: homocysteine S-methyltransferase family protein [Solirubrobacterales bacterium]|nr:homocysteine S-methyltransferase family protein [Solirubrobacterales bacterium]
MALPDGSQLFIGDGGLETVMIFEEGLELPEFAAFPLLRDEAGRAALRRYYEGFLAIAAAHGTGFLFDPPTWRASGRWGEALGYSAAEVADLNREAVAFARDVCAGAAGEVPVAIAGTIGPEGDAYSPDSFLSAAEAEDYHARQIAVFAAEGVDMISSMTITYVEEGVGIVRAAAAVGLPVSVSFTVEADGRLPSGEPLREAVERLDDETGGAALYQMINCAHPTHFAAELAGGEAWLSRIGGIRANASRRSHAELDEAEELDAGDPEELGAEYAALEPRLPDLRVVAGCCGTDRRHVACISARLAG